MTVHLLQTNIQFQSPAANHQAVEQLLSACVAPPEGGFGGGLSLFVLPEMWSTGFVMSPEGVAEEHDESLAWMRRMAEKYNAAFTGSVAVCEGGSYYNRLYFVKPDGSVTHYDKRHLFTYGGENRCYTPGSDRTIVEWGGVRFCLQICYDLRFPCFSRNVPSPLPPHPSPLIPHPSPTTPHSSPLIPHPSPLIPHPSPTIPHSSPLIPHPSPLIPYDCLIYVASWPASRRNVWDILLRARAIENQSYVIGVNRIGDDPACHYDGGTAVIDAYGRTVTQAHDNTQEIISCQLDIEKLQAFRKKFPVLRDADRHNLKY